MRWDRFRRLPIFPVVTISLVVFGALFADLLASHPPNETSLMKGLRPPFWIEGGSFNNPLGTDDLGRDILSRILHGGRISLVVAVAAVLGAGSIGISLGLVAGYVGGRTDAVIMRITDAAQAIPLILVSLLFVVTMGQSFANVIIAISVLLWSRYPRVIRSEALALRSRDYVKIARIAGASHFWIITRHIFPNALASAVVLLTLQVGIVIVIEASLSFLGAGVPPPAPAWGSMVSDGRNYIASAWWVSFFPGLAILLTVMSFNFLGDWLRDHLDPRLRQL
jgi:peptide/nickel transport system permease protein